MFVFSFYLLNSKPFKATNFVKKHIKDFEELTISVTGEWFNCHVIDRSADQIFREPLNEFSDFKTSIKG
jgi:hypothetical protein